MDTRFLESLLAVVDTGSIAGAARQQGLTAAAVSQRVRVLETEFGCQLLVRSAQSASPTGACLRLLPAARSLVRDAERLTVHVMPDGLSGPYRLGAISTALLDYVPKVVRQFRSQAPNVQLTVRPESSQSLYESLQADIIDAVIAVAPPFPVPKQMQHILLAEEPFCLIRPKEEAGAFSEGDLPWILYDRSTWGGRLLSGHFDNVRGDAPVLCELDSLETIAAMVEEGLGQAIVPVWASLMDQYQRLAVSSLEPGLDLQRSIVLLQKASSAVTAIDDLLKETLFGEV